MDEDEKRLSGRRHQPRFLAQLTQRSIRGLFAFLDFPAGKLPRAAQMLVVRATGDEDQPSSHDDRQSDVEAVDGVGDQTGAPAAPGL